MRAVILAAGYGTRLYPLTRDRPKALLPLGEKTIADRLLENLAAVPDLEEVLLVTNRRFAPSFREWAASRVSGRPIAVLDDGTTSNASRLGAIGDLRLALEARGIEGRWLVVAGDNLFPFEIRDVAAYFVRRKADVVTCYLQPDSRRLRRTGVAVLGDDDRVVELEEKPAAPRSRWAVPPLYFFREETARDVPAYLDAGEPPDAPGSFVAWLCRRTPVHAYRLAAGPVDVGTLESYLEADRRCSRGSEPAGD